MEGELENILVSNALDQTDKFDGELERNFIKEQLNQWPCLGVSLRATSPQNTARDGQVGVEREGHFDYEQV